MWEAGDQEAAALLPGQAGPALERLLQVQTWRLHGAATRRRPVASQKAY